MKHIKLGDLDVSRIGLGAMGMSAAYTGAGTDDAEYVRAIRQALDLGVTFSKLDTPPGRRRHPRRSRHAPARPLTRPRLEPIL